VADPLEALSRALAPEGAEAELVARTLELTRPLADVDLSLGVQHGDLSHPNLLELDNGGIGIVDWELAEVQGLPLYDASVFLAYAAFARAGARGVTAELRAFDGAFLHPGGWAARELAGLAARTGVPDELITPLFVACWARHTARTLIRAGGPTRAEAAAWLRKSRYYALWQRTVESAATLGWDT
jgi:aminoglycoside phosphotransferase (APT) family kinase protein